MKTITQRLSEEQIILLDGAMGTELFRRGVNTRLPFWSAHALIENPEMVRTIHEDYIRAGSEIITTNTFRTTSRALGKKGLGERAKELTYLAVNLARQARDESNKPVWIAGSVAPLEDCYEPNLMPDPETAFREHNEFIEWLVDSGVDLILIETMNTISEAISAARAAARHQLPIFVSWTCTGDGKILNGENLQDAIRSLETFKPAAFLVNCTPFQYIAQALQEMSEISKVPLGAYANIGRPEPKFGWEFTHDLDPSGYAEIARTWLRHGVKIIGGCCGTTPDHIQSLHSLR